MIFNLILVIGGGGISCEIVLRKMSSDLTDDKSTLVQFGAVRQQAITWANVDPDPCRHMASLGHNELKIISPHLQRHDFTTREIYFILTFEILVQ